MSRLASASIILLAVAVHATWILLHGGIQFGGR